MPPRPRSGQLTLQPLWFMTKLNNEHPIAQVHESLAVHIAFSS